MESTDFPRVKQPAIVIFVFRLVRYKYRPLQVRPSGFVSPLLPDSLSHAQYTFFSERYWIAPCISCPCLTQAEGHLVYLSYCHSIRHEIELFAQHPKDFVECGFIYSPSDPSLPWRVLGSKPMQAIVTRYHASSPCRQSRYLNGLSGST